MVTPEHLLYVWGASRRSIGSCLPKGAQPHPMNYFFCPLHQIRPALQKSVNVPDSRLLSLCLAAKYGIGVAQAQPVLAANPSITFGAQSEFQTPLPVMPEYQYCEDVQC